MICKDVLFQIPDKSLFIFTIIIRSDHQSLIIFDLFDFKVSEDVTYYTVM